MKVSELLTRLSYGELSGLSWTGEGNGAITAPERVQQIIVHANEALLRLYSKFVLKESELVLEEQSYLTHYTLDFAHAHSNADRPHLTPGYVVDARCSPFLDDVIKVFQVLDICRCTLPLNDVDHPQSVFTPTPSTIQIRYPVQNRIMSVLYQAKHVPLVTIDDVIHLPAVLEGALTSFIAHKVFHHMNGQENSAKSGEHSSIYETICENVTEMDLVSSSIADTNTRFVRNGWS